MKPIPSTPNSLVLCLKGWNLYLFLILSANSLILKSHQIFQVALDNLIFLIEPSIVIISPSASMMFKVFDHNQYQLSNAKHKVTHTSCNNCFMSLPAKFLLQHACLEYPREMFLLWPKSYLASCHLISQLHQK